MTRVRGFVFWCINRTVPRDSLNPYNLSLAVNGGMQWTPSRQKLIADLHSKQNITVNHVLLRLTMANGFNVTKIQRALKFDQNPL